MKRESAKAWEMIASGALRSIQYIKGPVGAVLTLEVGEEDEVKTLIDALPLVRAGLVNVDILALAPYTGFASLFATPE